MNSYYAQSLEKRLGAVRAG